MPLLCFGLLGLVTGALLVSYIVPGLIWPLRVVSGSMGSRLPGPHRVVVCRGCGLRFRCGLDTSRGDRVVCLNCHDDQASLSRLTVRPGQRVLTYRIPKRWGARRRWDVVIARHPRADDRLVVKRVVGLPGERICLWRGDVWVDGRVGRKSLQQLAEMALLVYDDTCRPGPWGTASRWRPTQADSRWRAVPGGFVIPSGGPTGSHGTPHSAPHQVAPHRNSTHTDSTHTDSTHTDSTHTDSTHSDSTQIESRYSDSPHDWLEYRHVNPISGPSEGDQAAPILDDCAYNQGISQELTVAADLLMTAVVDVGRTGTLHWRLGLQPTQLEVCWQPATGQLRLTDAGRVLVHNTVLPGRLQALPIWLAVCDRRVLLQVGDQRALAYDLGPEDRLGPAPFAWAAAAGMRARLTELRLWRDIHYLHPDGTETAWTISTCLGPDAYLLMGDNQAVSRDGRHAGEFGVVSGGQILGPAWRW